MSWNTGTRRSGGGGNNGYSKPLEYDIRVKPRANGSQEVTRYRFDQRKGEGETRKVATGWPLYLLDVVLPCGHHNHPKLMQAVREINAP